MMRSTVLLDDVLVDEAKSLSGIQKTSPMLNKVLRDYISRESALRLARLKGGETELTIPPRRRA